MNVVWLLPIPLVVASELRRRNARCGFGLALCTIGFLIAAVPERQTFPLNWPMYWPARWQFLIAEAMVLVGLLIHLRTSFPTSISKRAIEST
jgi:hypothetical protein